MKVPSSIILGNKIQGPFNALLGPMQNKFEGTTYTYYGNGNAKRAI